MNDGRELDTLETGVIRDADGVPVEWTLLHIGKNPVTRNGKPGVIDLTRQGMESILRYFREKGESIPVDSNHFLHELASRKGMDEHEVLQLLPSGVAAMGFGSLAEKDGQLRFRVKWNSLARELLKEKIFRYFSPAIRGLKHGPLRITSVALENEPAINKLDALTASAESHPAGPRGEQHQPETEKESDMDQEKENEAKKKNAGITEQLHAILGLKEDTPDSVLLLAVKTMMEKTLQMDKLKEQYEKAEQTILSYRKQEEDRKHAELIEQGEREGKITPATKEWWEKLDSVQLSAHLPNAPVLICQSAFSRAELPAERKDFLTAEDRRTCQRFGFTEKEFLNCKRQFGE